MVNRRFERLISDAAALNPQRMIEARRRLKRRFLTQRANGKSRDIVWRLSFDQWCAWWIETGHIDERGRERGQWVMARPFDSGPYEIGNLVCLRAENNVTQNHKLRAGEIMQRWNLYGPAGPAI